MARIDLASDRTMYRALLLREERKSASPILPQLREIVAILEDGHPQRKKNERMMAARAVSHPPIYVGDGILCRTCGLERAAHPHVGGGNGNGQGSAGLSTGAWDGARSPGKTETPGKADTPSGAAGTTAAIPLAQDSPNGGPCPRCGAARVVFDHDDGAAVYGCQECKGGTR